MDEINESSTVETFFQALLYKVETEGEYTPLFTELQYKTKSNPDYIGQVR